MIPSSLRAPEKLSICSWNRITSGFIIKPCYCNVRIGGFIVTKEFIFLAYTHIFIFDYDFGIT